MRPYKLRPIDRNVVGLGTDLPVMAALTLPFVFVILCMLPGSHTGSTTISNVVPRRDITGAIINAHAGGIYNFSGRFYLIGEHYRNCPHAGGNKTRDPLAVGNCEMCGHTGTTFALYESADLVTWTLTSTNVIPDKPGAVVECCIVHACPGL